eukprot:3941416-Rhodomonas_salina.5
MCISTCHRVGYTSRRRTGRALLEIAYEHRICALLAMSVPDMAVSTAEGGRGKPGRQRHASPAQSSRPDSTIRYLSTPYPRYHHTLAKYRTWRGKRVAAYLISVPHSA